MFLPHRKHTTPPLQEFGFEVFTVVTLKSIIFWYVTTIKKGETEP
jgi:hypothetical protein